MKLFPDPAESGGPIAAHRRRVCRKNHQRNAPYAEAVHAVLNQSTHEIRTDTQTPVLRVDNHMTQPIMISLTPHRVQLTIAKQAWIVWIAKLGRFMIIRHSVAAKLRAGRAGRALIRKRPTALAFPADDLLRRQWPRFAGRQPLKIGRGTDPAADRHRVTRGKRPQVSEKGISSSRRGHDEWNDHPSRPVDRDLSIRASDYPTARERTRTSTP